MTLLSKKYMIGVDTDIMNMMDKIPLEETFSDKKLNDDYNQTNDYIKENHPIPHMILNNVWPLVVEKYIQPDNIQSLLITSGILLKTAIQLYTVGLLDNEEVEKILDFAKDSIEPLREKTTEMIDIENRTLH